MAQNKSALQLGGGLVHVGGRTCGQVSNIQLRRDVTKVEHMTNVHPEFRRDFVLPIESRVGVRWTFGEISPWAMNILMGMPGYRQAPYDRTLAGAGAAPPGTISKYPLLMEQNPTLPVSLDHKPMWTTLMHPLDTGVPGTPESPLSIQANNLTAAPNSATTTYYGFFASVLDSTKAKESMIRGAAIVPVFNISTLANTVQVVVGLSANAWAFHSSSESTLTEHDTSMFVRLYRFGYSKVAENGMFQGTSAGITGAIQTLDSGGVAKEVAITSDDLEAGYKVITLTLSTFPLAAGLPNINQFLKVENVNGETLKWLDEYEVIPFYNGGAAIRLAATFPTSPSGVTAWDLVKVTYTYDGAQVYEIPIGIQGQNPIIPVTIEIPYPDKKSKIIIEVPRVQINNSATFSPNERDWSGIDFDGDALDASDEFPDYPYGWIQFRGPLATSIVKGGNVKWGSGRAYDLGGVRTTYS